MADNPASLSEAEAVRAAHAVANWRAEPDAPVTCPRCGAGGLQVIDCSARPHAEWYKLGCSLCGLDAVLNIPMAPPG